MVEAVTLQNVFAAQHSAGVVCQKCGTMLTIPPRRPLEQDSAR
jgi:hypothetical protein